MAARQIGSGIDTDSDRPLAGTAAASDPGVPGSAEPDPGALRARVQVLEAELRDKMQEIAQLERELRSAKSDLEVKDEFIRSLHLERRRGAAPPLRQLFEPKGLRRLAAWVLGPRAAGRVSRLNRHV